MATFSKCKGSPTVENGIGNYAKGHEVYYIRKGRFNCKGQREYEEMAPLNSLKGNMLSTLVSFFVYSISQEELINNSELQPICYKHEYDVQIYTLF